jgi:hypothetical protein
MKTKKALISNMLNILAEANDLDADIIDHHTFYEAYSRAADMLNYEEDEDGEFDIYEFTYNLGDSYFGLYKQLKQILIDEGLITIEQRKAFIQKTFVIE